MFEKFKKITGLGMKKTPEMLKEDESKKIDAEREEKEKKLNKFINDMKRTLWDIVDNKSIYEWGCYTGNMEKQEKKQENVMNSYGRKFKGYPIILVDTTTFGKADNGITFTSEGIALCEAHETYAQFIAYKDINKKLYISDGELKYGSNEYKFYATSTLNKIKPVIDLINLHVELETFK